MYRFFWLWVSCKCTLSGLGTVCTLTIGLAGCSQKIGTVRCTPTFGAARCGLVEAGGARPSRALPLRVATKETWQLTQCACTCRACTKWISNTICMISTAAPKITQNKQYQPSNKQYLLTATEYLLCMQFFKHSMCRGWRNICELSWFLLESSVLSWFLLESSVLCYLLCYSRWYFILKNFWLMTHVSSWFLKND